MRVMFMGTPDIAVPCLEALIEKHNVVCVVTQPDKPKNRGQKMAMSPVKELALTHNIDVLQPTRFKDEAFLPELEKYNPDVIVVIAYGRILPKYVLEYPKHGCINVHASLLPKYRGAAPIQWCIVDGEKVTVRAMDRTGDVYEYEGEKLLARAFCHEIEHLDGILFSSHVSEFVEPEK